MSICSAVVEARQTPDHRPVVVRHHEPDCSRRRLGGEVELALEQARYESNRARRQYDAVDPEHRIVAAELERLWNERLMVVREDRWRVCGVFTLQPEEWDALRPALEALPGFEVISNALPSEAAEAAPAE